MLPAFDSKSVVILCASDCNFEILVASIEKLEKIEDGVDGTIFRAAIANVEDEVSLFSILEQNSYFRIFENCWASRKLYKQENNPVTKKFFDLIAFDYDLIVHKEWNVACYEHLFSRVTDSETKAPSIFDFGCGTGIIKLTSFADGASSIIGFDFCEKMSLLARRRGLHTLSSSEFNDQKEKSFDLILSSYVLHYGISHDVFLKVVYLIKSGGKFVANLHKNIEVSSYMKLCNSLDFSKFRYELDHSPFGSVLIIERLRE